MSAAIRNRQGYFTVEWSQSSVQWRDEMKRLGWILVILMLVSPAWAAKRVTVDQLEQILTDSRYKPDAEVARHLTDLELTERLNSTGWRTGKPLCRAVKLKQS